MAKILFIQNCYYELIGIASISAYIKSKHQSFVVYGASGDIVERYRSLKPDVVGIYATTKDHAWLSNIAALIKSVNKHAIIMAGGPHVTFYNNAINDNNIDIICIGEGEKPTLNLLNKIETNENYANVPSLWVKMNGKVYKNGLDTLLEQREIPIPDRVIYNELTKIYEKNSLTVMCSRGCPFCCSFCSAKGYREMYGTKYYRMRTIKDVIAEIIYERNHRKIEIIKFQDDIFGMDKKWTEEFLIEYKRSVGCKFYCLLRADLVDKVLLDKIEDAGCYRIGVGIESGDDNIRNKLLGKNLSISTIMNFAKIMKGRNIKFHTFNMFGLPGEDLANALKTLELNIKISPDIAYSTIFQPYPGTDYFLEEAKARILSPDFNQFKINYRYSKDAAQIQRLQKLFMLTVKFPMLAYFIPILVRLPLDGIYDKISQLSWLYFYKRNALHS